MQLRDSTIRSQYSLIKNKKFADREFKVEKVINITQEEKVEEIFLN
jgi:hypothetical protein